MTTRCWWIVLLVWGFAPGLCGAQEAAGSGYHEQPAWFKNSFLDIREDVAEAAVSGHRLILYFYQDGCPYCKKLLEVNFGQRAIVDQTRRNFDVVALNLWGDREVTDLAGRRTTEKAFAVALKVMFTPTLVFLDEHGKVVLRLNGYYPPHTFRVALDYVAGHKERQLSFRDYLASVAPRPARASLHQEPGFLQPPYRLDRRGAHPRPLLVMFEQTHCKACDELHGDILQRPASRTLLAHFDVALLDMWEPTPVETPDGRHSDAAAWAQMLKVQYAPTLVFFDAAGHEVFRTEAYLKAFHLQSALDYVASGAYRDQPNFQRYLQARADALRARGVPVDLMR